MRGMTEAVQKGIVPRFLLENTEKYNRGTQENQDGIIHSYLHPVYNAHDEFLSRESGTWLSGLWAQFVFSEH
jgi:hypothetical protein